MVRKPSKLQYWTRNPSLKNVLYVLCILAARFSQLKDVDVDLLSLSTFVDDSNHACTKGQVPALLENFYRFLCGKLLIIIFLVNTFPFYDLLYIVIFLLCLSYS